MKLEYDPEADGLYISFGRRQRSHRTEEMSRGPSMRLVDYGADGSPIGIEILGTKAGIDVIGLPREQEVASLLERHGFRVVTLLPEN